MRCCGVEMGEGGCVTCRSAADLSLKTSDVIAGKRRLRPFLNSVLDFQRGKRGTHKCPHIAFLARLFKMVLYATSHANRVVKIRARQLGESVYYPRYFFLKLQTKDRASPRLH